MRISICDGDASYRSNLRSMIVEYKINNNMQVDIYEFDDGETMLSSLLTFDLVFLGYKFPNANGMEAARRLRTRDSMCSIVFVTEHPDFVYESFEVNPFRFLKKPIEKDQIFAVLDSYIENKRHISPISLICESEKTTLLAEDIIYLEGDGKRCIIRTRYKTYTCSKTLSRVFDNLPKRSFYRIHKSYIVNMAYIRDMDGKTVTFINGEKASISKKYFTDFKKYYLEFCKFLHPKA